MQQINKANFDTPIDFILSSATTKMISVWGIMFSLLIPIALLNTYQQKQLTMNRNKQSKSTVCKQKEERLKKKVKEHHDHVLED